MSFEQLLAQQRQHSALLETELQNVRVELAAALESAAKSAGGLSSEQARAKEAAAQLEAEREKRIEQIGSQGMR
eukprot:6477125-Prymnesium_polylepis.1